MLNRSFRLLKHSNRTTVGRLTRGLTTLVSKDADKISVSELQSAIKRLENDLDLDYFDTRLSLISKINKSSNAEKQLLLNELIPSYRFFFIMSPEHRKEVITTNEILNRLIEINPGRVHTSWELFKEWKDNVSGGISTEVVNQILEKLIYGDSSETDGEKYVISYSQFQKIDQVLKNHVQSFDEVEIKINNLFEKLIEDNKLLYINILIENFGEKLLTPAVLQKILDKDFVTDTPYLTIFSSVFEKNPSLLSKQQLVEALNILERRSSSYFQEQRDNLDKQHKHDNITTALTHFSPDQLLESIVQFVEENGLDLDKSPESLLIRMKLIETYGIKLNNLDTALKKFHTYQTHEKFGIEFVQINLVKSFAVQSFKEENESFLKIAETLIPQDQDQIAIKMLQMLIVGHSNFNDAETSLKIYNDYIQKVSKDVNEYSKRSAAGQLTEALLIANLYNNDRNFAQLLLDKAIENNILHDEYEITQIKQWLKKYGESFVENDDWQAAKPNFKSHVLNFLQQL
ncbi:uncharacterized protein RJT21DRAFT_46354 [Scheffersomyces amazonensis]|uniref:uncharacterized protein n=1 Tax=Scheffersomyces amazonensis TaxID=1078765 RepID=UPI00315C5D40